MTVWRCLAAIIIALVKQKIIVNKMDCSEFYVFRSNYNNPICNIQLVNANNYCREFISLSFSDIQDSYSNPNKIRCKNEISILFSWQHGIFFNHTNHTTTGTFWRCLAAILIALVRTNIYIFNKVNCSEL